MAAGLLTAGLLTGCAGAAAGPAAPGAVVRGGTAPDQAEASPDPADHGGVATERDEPASLSDQGLARGDGSAADDVLRLGDEAWRSGRWREALEHYERARQLAPSDPAPWVGVARAVSAEVPLTYGAAEGSQEMGRAVEALDRALALQEDFDLARFEKGRTLLALGRAQEARRLLEGVTERFPNDAEAQSSLGVALLASGDPRAAMERFERAAQLESDRPERFANLGTAQMMLGEVENAARSYRTAVRLAPQSAQYQNDLGTALLAQGDGQGAMEHLARAVAIEPDRATFLSNLAYAHLAGGRNAEALRIARRATVLDPKLGSAWINLGTAEARLGRLDDARRAIRRALDLDPTDPRARAVWAELDELEAAADD